MAVKKSAPKKVVKEEPKVKEEVKTEEVVEKQEFFEEKADKKSILSRTINIFLWIILFAWMAVCTVDFVLVKMHIRPIFTFDNKVIEHDDGNVYRYTGLGYRVYFYERDSYAEEWVQFGPFWLEESFPEFDEQ